MTIVLNSFLGNLLIFISLGFFPGFYLVLQFEIYFSVFSICFTFPVIRKLGELVTYSSLEVYFCVGAFLFSQNVSIDFGELGLRSAGPELLLKCTGGRGFGGG